MLLLPHSVHVCLHHLIVVHHHHLWVHIRLIIHATHSSHSLHGSSIGTTVLHMRRWATHWSRSSLHEIRRRKHSLSTWWPVFWRHHWVLSLLIHHIWRASAHVWCSSILSHLVRRWRHLHLTKLVRVPLICIHRWHVISSLIIWRLLVG